MNQPGISKSQTSRNKQKIQDAINKYFGENAEIDNAKKQNRQSISNQGQDQQVETKHGSILNNSINGIKAERPS